MWLRQAALVGYAHREPAAYARGLFDLEPGLTGSFVGREQRHRPSAQGVARVGDGNNVRRENRLRCLGCSLLVTARQCSPASPAATGSPHRRPACRSRRPPCARLSLPRITRIFTNSRAFSFRFVQFVAENRADGLLDPGVTPLTLRCGRCGCVPLWLTYRLHLRVHPLQQMPELRHRQPAILEDQSTNYCHQGSIACYYTTQAMRNVVYPPF